MMIARARLLIEFSAVRTIGRIEASMLVKTVPIITMRKSADNKSSRAESGMTSQ